MTGIPPELIKRKYDRVVLRSTEEKKGVRRNYMIPIVNGYID